MKKEFSLEEKMSAIGLVFQGESARSVSRKLHLGHHLLYEWIESYKLLKGDSVQYGIDIADLKHWLYCAVVLAPGTVLVILNLLYYARLDGILVYIVSTQRIPTPFITGG